MSITRTEDVVIGEHSVVKFEVSKDVFITDEFTNFLCSFVSGEYLMLINEETTYILIPQSYFDTEGENLKQFIIDCGFGDTDLNIWK